MSDPVIEFRHVSKRFTYIKNRPDSLKSLFISVASGKYFRLERESKVVLDDVSFTINRGEAVGVMGRNGTGKSTMLRILSGIYQSDAGQVTVNERVAPLVALGAGFHGELSGLENMYLNAAILGIPRGKMAQLVPSIIEFSELGNQIYHPVKTYSSGMTMRLGFSVASHVDAPIIVLDEVLGVGDQGFQKKCMQKLREMFASGRTIILVTHDPIQVREFCQRCLVFESGKIVYDGPSDVGSRKYSEMFAT